MVKSFNHLELILVVLLDAMLPCRFVPTEFGVEGIGQTGLALGTFTIRGFYIVFEVGPVSLLVVADYAYLELGPCGRLCNLRGSLFF